MFTLYSIVLVKIFLISYLVGQSLLVVSVGKSGSNTDTMCLYMSMFLSLQTTWCWGFPREGRLVLMGR